MKRLFGGLLLAIGTLIAGASGLCSAVFAVDLLGSGNIGESIGLLLLFGGIPFAIGVGLFFAGLTLVRSARD